MIRNKVIFIVIVLVLSNGCIETDANIDSHNNDIINADSQNVSKYEEYTTNLDNQNVGEYEEEVIISDNQNIDVYEEEIDG